MFFRSRSHFVIACALAFLLSLGCAALVRAQDDEDFDDAADPVQLFKRAQDAHARGQYEQALSLYEAALKVRPDFPEALFQQGNALVSLNRFSEAEKSFLRARALRADWSLPPAALSALLLRTNRLDEAAKYLESALELERNNAVALIALTDLRLRTRAEQPALESLLKRLEQATAQADAEASLWVARASLERALKREREALVSLNRALEIDKRSVPALMERAEAFMAQGNIEMAVRDAQAARELAPHALSSALLLADALARAGRTAEALQVLNALDENQRQVPEVLARRKALESPALPETEDRAELEKLLTEQPRNAPLLGRLCVLYRADDPARALVYCQRALAITPTNTDYATGAGAALVQLKRYEEAVALLRKVVAVAPDYYAAHANLATALYQLKRYEESLVEYNWIVAARPDLAVAYFFIATAYDQLGRFELALAAYEKFLERADARTNQLEIDKVKLRLPPLRNQIRRGEGAKNKKGE